MLHKTKPSWTSKFQIKMVDEGLFTSLDWHEQSLKYKPLPRTLGILWILVERMKIMVETKKNMMMIKILLRWMKIRKHLLQKVKAFGIRET